MTRFLLRVVVGVGILTILGVFLAVQIGDRIPIGRSFLYWQDEVYFHVDLDRRLESPFPQLDGYGFSWTPDGEYITYFAGQQLHFVSASSGRTEFTRTLPETIDIEYLYSLNWSPDGGAILFDGFDEVENHRLYVVEVTDEYRLDSSLELSVSANGYFSIDWSQDSAYLALLPYYDTRELFVYDRNQDVATSYSIDGFPMLGIQWLDNSHVGFIREDGKLYSISIDRGEINIFGDLDMPPVLETTGWMLSPNRQYLFFVRIPDTRLYSVDIATRTIHNIPNPDIVMPSNWSPDSKLLVVYHQAMPEARWDVSIVDLAGNTVYFIRDIDSWFLSWRPQ